MAATAISTTLSLEKSSVSSIGKISRHIYTYIYIYIERERERERERDGSKTCVYAKGLRRDSACGFVLQAVCVHACMNRVKNHAMRHLGVKRIYACTAVRLTWGQPKLISTASHMCVTCRAASIRVLGLLAQNWTTKGLQMFVCFFLFVCSFVCAYVHVCVCVCVSS